MENEHLRVFIKSTLTKELVQQLEITVVDDNYFSCDGRNCEKMAKKLKRHTQLYEATPAGVQFDKTYFLVGNGREKMVN